MGLKSAVDAWYDNQNYFAQTVIQFVTSILVLFAITGLGGLVFCGFENSQARARPRLAPGWAGAAGRCGGAPRVCGAARCARSCHPVGAPKRPRGSPTA